MFKFIQFFNSRIVLLFIIVTTVLLHLTFLDMPPKSMHLWRQANTLSMTRNFFEEGMDPFKPRVDNRFNTDGITGSQFPSFEIVLAKIYQYTGEQYWVQRSYCLLLHLFGIFGIFLLAKQLTSNRLVANLAAWTYAWSPMLFYYAITALPDNMALPTSILGLYFFLRWFDTWVVKDSKSTIEMLLCLFFVVIAGLTKIQYLALCFFIVAFVWLQREKLKSFHWMGFVVFGIIVSSICISWYVYADLLIQKSGLSDIGLSFNSVSNIMEGLDILIFNLTSSLPELILNYTSFVLLIVAGYFLVIRKKGNTVARISFFIWAFVFVIFHLFELERMKHHDYYMMAYMPILTIASAYGGFHLLNTRYRVAGIVLIVVQPVLAYARIVPSRLASEETGANKVFYKQEELKKLQELVPNNALCIVGPDDSRCIYFYFLRKKGFGFGEEGLTEQQIESYVDKGAKYLYTSNSEMSKSPQIAPYILLEIYNADHFFVYSLKKPSK